MGTMHHVVTMQVKQGQIRHPVVGTMAVSLMSREEAVRERERIMDQMSDTAQQRGLTPEKLEELLAEDDDD